MASAAPHSRSKQSRAAVRIQVTIQYNIQSVPNIQISNLQFALQIRIGVMFVLLTLRTIYQLLIEIQYCFIIYHLHKPNTKVLRIMLLIMI